MKEDGRDDEAEDMKPNRQAHSDQKLQGRQNKSGSEELVQTAHLMGCILICTTCFESRSPSAHPSRVQSALQLIGRERSGRNISGYLDVPDEAHLSLHPSAKLVLWTILKHPLMDLWRSKCAALSPQQLPPQPGSPCPKRIRPRW